MIDHLLYITPDLAATVDDLSRRFGVQLTPGGRHVTLGTRNYLADLGGRTYLEILGPDPTLPRPEEGRPLGIDDLTEPRLATWAERVADLPAAVAAATEHGCVYDPIFALSRDREDGVRLEWQMSAPADGTSFDGVIPLLIHWDSEAYAAELSAKGVELVSLTVHHPQAAIVRHQLAAFGPPEAVTTQEADEPSLRVALKTPNGEVELR